MAFKKNSNTVLIVDDEKDIRELVSDLLEDEGYQTECAAKSDDVFLSCARSLPDIVLLDVWLKESELDGLGILEVLKRRYPSLPVVVISGHGTIETAKTSIRMGAYDYVEKPFDQERLLHIISRAIETNQLQGENELLKEYKQECNVLLGTSAIVTLFKQALDKQSQARSRVFLKGEHGTGKEIIARMLHDKSDRSGKPFIPIHVSQYDPEELAEFLFGTEEVQDLNAPPRKIGVLEKAHGGTIFIDEITLLGTEIQAKLLKYLQENKFYRLGGSEFKESDVRIVSSSRYDVEKALKDGVIKREFLDRLAVVVLDVPSLSERLEDIPILCDALMAVAAAKYKLPRKQFSEGAVAALQTYHWPGNIRQLQNVVEWLLVINPASGEEIRSSDMPRDIMAHAPMTFAADETGEDIMSMSLREAREMFEKQYLVAQINRFSGNISKTANFIGMERSALHRKLKNLDIDYHERDEKVPA